MNQALTFRLMTAEDVLGASRLIVEVFNQSIAPLYSPEGVQEFLSYAAAASMAARSEDGHFVLLACAGGRIEAVAEIRDHQHLSMFFVSGERQRSGVGRKLLRRAIEICREARPELESLSVHASPNSVTAYEQLGFIATGAEQTVNGIRFTPMALSLHMLEATTGS